jgi:PPM family protein phosphatase
MVLAMQEQSEMALAPQISLDEDDILNMAALPYQVLTVGLSDMGLVRQNNEDVWGEVPALNLLVLADGMGGHRAGEVAAQEAVTTLCRTVKRRIAASKKPTLADFQELLKRSIVYVNSQVYQLSRSHYDLRGMGTTLCCLLFHPEGLAFAHVGDSRIYRWRQSVLEQLTKDHSLLRDLVDQGQLNDTQAIDFLYKNIITKAIGTELKVEPSLQITDVEAEDLYLMCSDGLSDLLDANEIAQILNTAPSPHEAAQALIDKANEAGGKDNITVVIAKIQK